MAITPPAPRRRYAVALSAAFFVGLALTLTVLGTIAAIIGRLLTQWRSAFALGAATLTLAAGFAALFRTALRRRVPDPEVH